MNLAFQHQGGYGRALAPTPLPANNPTGMRELSMDEIDHVSGGILPFIIGVVALDLALITFTMGVVDGYLSTRKMLDQ